MRQNQSRYGTKLSHITRYESMKLISLSAKGLISALLFGYISGCGDFESRSVPLKAEDIAITKAGSFMCLTKDEADAFMQHAVSGERSMLEQILNTGRCSLVHQGMQVKIIMIRDSSAQIVRIDVPKATPLWTASAFLEKKQ